MPMHISMRYFALVREELSQNGETIELPVGSTIDDLTATLRRRHESLRELLPHLRFAVNRQFVGGAHVLQDRDEVALIPPVAGGRPRVRVVEESIQPQTLVDEVQGDQHGAVVTFTGVVRDTHQGRAVQTLEYEAYTEMAEEKLEEIATEIDERWPDCQVAVVHRTGLLTVGEVAVVIAVASPHRQEAFEACRFYIDRIKEDVPIWKKETGPDGSSWVTEGL